jgi:hypothetical protein
MNPKLLQYALDQAAIGVNIMARDRTTVHLFDLGKTKDGKEFVFVQAIVPKEYAKMLPTIPSQPLTSIEA